MATRFKLTADATAPAVSPALQSYSHTQTTRRQLLTSDTSALATVAYTPDAADHLVAGDAHHIQFVSAGMAAGINFTNAETIKFCIQGLEANAGNNLFVQVFVSVVSNDGSTVRRTLRAKSADATELATALTARFHTTTQDGATYTTVAGDRLVVEFSVTGTCVGAGGVQGHNASLRWGGNGAGGDLLENDTETGTTRNPWIEFVPNITFGTTHSATNTETETIEDIQSAARSRAVTSTEPETIEDVLSATQTASRSATEAAGVADAPAAAWSGARSRTEDAGITEVQAASRVTGASEQAAAGAIDSQVAGLSLGVNRVESAGAADAQGATRTAARSSAEAAGIADALSATWAGNRSLAEAIGAASAQGATWTGNRALSEGTGITDAASVLLITSPSLTESAVIADSLSATLIVVTSRVESAGITDALTGDTQGAQTGAVVESIGVADVVGATLAVSSSLSEALGVIDAVTAYRSFDVSVLDAEGISDSLSVNAALAAWAVEAFAGADSFDVIVTYNVAANESIGITDVTNWQGAAEPEPPPTRTSRRIAVRASRSRVRIVGELRRRSGTRRKR